MGLDSVAGGAEIKADSSAALRNDNKKRQRKATKQATAEH
jgi:hypothetical protein